MTKTFKEKLSYFATFCAGVITVLLLGYMVKEASECHDAKIEAAATRAMVEAWGRAQ